MPPPTRRVRRARSRARQNGVAERRRGLNSCLAANPSVGAACTLGGIGTAKSTIVRRATGPHPDTHVPCRCDAANDRATSQKGVLSRATQPSTRGLLYSLPTVSGGAGRTGPFAGLTMAMTSTPLSLAVLIIRSHSNFCLSYLPTTKTKIWRSGSSARCWVSPKEQGEKQLPCGVRVQRDEHAHRERGVSGPGPKAGVCFEVKRRLDDRKRAPRCFAVHLCTRVRVAPWI